MMFAKFQHAFQNCKQQFYHDLHHVNRPEAKPFGLRYVELARECCVLRDTGR